MMKYLLAVQQVHCVEVKEVGGMVANKKVEIPRYVVLAQLGEQCFKHIVGREVGGVDMILCMYVV